MKLNHFSGFISQIILVSFLLLATMLGQAQTLTLSNPYHFRHTDSRYGNDNHYIGVTASPSASGGTSVTATQGSVTLPLTDFGNGEFFVSTPYNPSLTGAWQLNAQNGAETTQAQTNAIDGVGPMPFVQNLTSSGGLPTPTLTWTLPPPPTEPFTQTRVRIYDGVTNSQVNGTFPVGLNTSFTVPAGLLDSNGRYNFRVMLENVTSNVLLNRSSTYISLPAQGVMHGQIHQIDGTTPIGGATVEALGVSSGTPSLIPTTTDATGNYSVSLPSGSYRVRAKAPGYAREYFDNVTPSNEATVLNVTEGSSVVANFNLNEGGAITGHVYQSDGVTPITNANVFIRPSNYFFDDGFRINTASDGSYAVDGLALGQYKVTAESPNYASKKYYDNIYGWSNSNNVAVTPPNTTTGVNINLDIGASISGYVLDASGTTPIGNVGLIADSPGFEGIGSRSNADGSYTISGLPPGGYTIRIGEFIPGWYAGEFYDSKYTWGTADRVPVAEGENKVGIDFTLDEGGAITGQVFDKNSGNPLSGIHMRPFFLNGDGLTPLVWTDANGRYRVNLRPGTYAILGYGEPNYISQWYQEASNIGSATPVIVNFKQETSGVDLYLTRPGSISGQVFEIDGVTPISGASVFAFPVGSQTGSGANSGPDGRYKIEGLVSGNYVARVTVTGHVSDNTPVEVTAPNEMPNINFLLDTYPYPVKIIGQGVVGQQGGSVTVSDTSSPLINVGVEVPAGALSDYKVIDIGEVDAPALPPGLIGIGVPVHFGPEGLQFTQPATLKIPYKQEDLNNAGITDPNQLDVYTFNITNLTWMLVTGAKTVDTVNRMVMIAVDHFSIFRLAVPQISNEKPIAHAGSNQTVRLGSLVMLDGRASSDPDQGPSPLSFVWTQTTGPNVALTGANTPQPTFTPTVAGAYTFSLTVNDGQDDSVPAAVTITVPALGDLNNDGVIDQNDLNLLLAARNTPANGPNDLRDLDGDGTITALDARKLTLLCTYPRCAVIQ